MRLTTKSRYGLRAIFDMAYNGFEAPAQIQEISKRQNISPRYLEQIFQKLKKSGVLKSKRGPQGGYILAKKPSEIRLIDILSITEGDLFIVSCSEPDHKCENSFGCITKDVWDGASEALHQYFSNITLEDLCKKASKMGIKKEEHTFMYYI